MRICVTAANCFIGFPLVKKLSEEGHEVIAVVRKGNNRIRDLSCFKGVRVLELDFEEYYLLGEKIGPIDCLVLLTWSGTRGNGRLDETIQKNNLFYSKQAIESVSKQGCKRIVTAGSQAEYGLHKNVVNENEVCKPNTAYGKYKLLLYNFLKKKCLKEHISFKEPRFFSVYGPGDYAGSMVMDTIKKMRNEEDCFFTKATQKWNYLFIDDAIDAVFRLCTLSCPDGAYNLGSDDTRLLKEYIIDLKRIIHSNSQLFFGYIPYGQSGVVNVWPDISKAKKELFWEPQFDFKSGIMRILETLNE